MVGFLLGVSRWCQVMPSQPNETPLVHILDDDASMRDALVDLFDSVKLETRTYATAHDFLTSALKDRPGCIVLDIRLPDMNGDRKSVV